MRHQNVLVVVDLFSHEIIFFLSAHLYLVVIGIYMHKWQKLVPIRTVYHLVYIWKWTKIFETHPVEVCVINTHIQLPRSFLNQHDIGHPLSVSNFRDKFSIEQAWTIFMVASAFSGDCHILRWDTHRAQGLMFNKWHAILESMPKILWGEIAKRSVLALRNSKRSFFTLADRSTPTRTNHIGLSSSNMTLNSPSRIALKVFILHLVNVLSLSSNRNSSFVCWDRLHWSLH